MDLVIELIASAQVHGSHGDDGISKDFFMDSGHACCTGQKLKLAMHMTKTNVIKFSHNLVILRARHVAVSNYLREVYDQRKYTSD